MIPLLLACLRNNLVGGGGGGPFAISATALTQYQAGTSCANPLKFNVSLTYTGSPVGKTCKVEHSWDGGAYAVVATGVAPTAFPYLLSVEGYYNKFGIAVDSIVRVTDEADATNTATSVAYQRTYTRCDL
jgi:hypothetical protein